jgi:threonylcarbamoyladenosine tRNA methylthiotransferase MtaB
MNYPARKKIAFHTLGCKLNFAETSTISRSFPEDKYEKVSAGQKADIYIINTCSVTDAADKKCRQAIRKFINMSPDAIIAVVGCYAQLKPEMIASIPGVDLVLGVNERFNIAYYIESLKKKSPCLIDSSSLTSYDKFIPSFSAGDRTRSFLKIQDGCDYWCAYCTIPLARGPSRNPEIATLVDQAMEITARGIKEIVLTGINIGDFGKTTNDSLIDLMTELLKVPGIERYRISSIEPNLITDEIIEFISDNPRFLPHFHIPLQSGSDKILRLMKRRYSRDLFRERVETITGKLQYAGIGTDIITGFPGESEKDFEDAFRFLEELPLSYLHVFPYSERPATHAINLPGKVKNQEKEKRSKKLLALSDEKHRKFLENNIGQVAEVLFEKVRSAGMITGLTGNYIRVEYPWQSNLAEKIRKVRLKDISTTGRMSIDIID